MVKDETVEFLPQPGLEELRRLQNNSSLETAIGTLLERLARQPEDALSLVALARAYLELGKNELAMKALGNASRYTTSKTLSAEIEDIATRNNFPLSFRSDSSRQKETLNNCPGKDNADSKKFLVAGEILSCPVRTHSHITFQELENTITHALIQFRLGNHEKSEEAFLKAFEFDFEGPALLGKLRFFLATLEMMKGELDRAAEEIEYALEYSPDSPNYHALSGQINLLRDNMEEADSILTAALERWPEDYGLNYWMGVYELKKGLFELSRERFRKCIALNGDIEDAYLNVVNLSILLGELDKAQSAVQEALKRFPGRTLSFFKQVDLILSGDPAASDSRLFRIIRLFINGIEAMEKQDFEKAEKLFNQALEYEPSLAAASFMLGEIRRFQNRLAESIVFYDQALEKNNRYADATFFAGISLALQNKPEEAIKRLKKAIEIEPSHFLATMNLGTIYSAIGEHELAIEFSKKALQIASAFDLETYRRHSQAIFLTDYNLAVNLANSGVISRSRQKLEEARYILKNRVLKIQPDFKPALDELQRIEKYLARFVD